MRDSFRKGRLNALGPMMNKSLESLGLNQRIAEYQAIHQWAEVVGPQISAVTVPQKVWDGVLFIACKSSMWSSELSLHKQDIVNRLNAAVGKKAIKDIRFSARGYRKALEEVQKEDFSSKAKGLDKVELDKSEEEAAFKLAANAPSPELAEKIMKAVMSSKRLSEIKRSEGWKKCSRCGAMHKGESDLCRYCG